MRFVAAALLALVAGCTSSAPGPAPMTLTTTQTRTISHSAPPPTTSRPVQSGPTQAVDAASCPLLQQQSAADKVGMRLGRITVLRSGGTLAGCRFYAVQGTSFNQSEHLPGPDQPAIEITATRYRDPSAAHNAFVALGTHGQHVQRATIATGNIGLCFQTAFYPKDHGQDWACTFSVGDTVVLVRTVVTSPAFNAIQLAKAVAPKF